MKIKKAQEKQTTKKRRKFLWMPLLFSLAFAIGFFGYNIFWPDLSPEMTQKTHQSFVNAIADEAPRMANFPAPRILKFKNARGYPTGRIVMITDYRLSKIEGCVSYHYAFSKEEKISCTPYERKSFENKQSIIID